jgi:hypothetical protein
MPLAIVFTEGWFLPKGGSLPESPYEILLLAGDLELEEGVLSIALHQQNAVSSQICTPHCASNRCATWVSTAC